MWTLEKWAFHTVVLSIVLQILPACSGLDSFCREDKQTVVINGTQSGTIKTLYEGETYYGNDRYCAWQIEGDGDPNTRIQITVTLTDLDWAPESAICSGYDHVVVYDADSVVQEKMIVSWCSHQNPHAIITSGTAAYIVFQTNDRNTANKRGAVLDFQLFTLSPDPNACPLGWTESHGGNHCYRMWTHVETFHVGQRYCNYEQSNLVTFENDPEADFVKNNIMSGAKGSVWIGLNDLTENGRYEWLGKIASTATYRWVDDPHSADPFLHCVTMDAKSGLLREKFCTESEVQTLVKYPFVCKRQKAEDTKIFVVPQDPSDEGGRGHSRPIHWFILGPLIGLLVIGGVAALIILKKRSDAKKPKRAPSPETNYVPQSRSEPARPYQSYSSHPSRNSSNRNVSGRPVVHHSANVNRPRQATQTSGGRPPDVDVDVHVHVHVGGSTSSGNIEPPPPYSAQKSSTNSCNVASAPPYSAS